MNGKAHRGSNPVSALKGLVSTIAYRFADQVEVLHLVKALPELGHHCLVPLGDHCPEWFDTLSSCLINGVALE